MDFDQLNAPASPNPFHLGSPCTVRPRRQSKKQVAIGQLLTLILRRSPLKMKDKDIGENAGRQFKVHKKHKGVLI